MVLLLYCAVSLAFWGTPQFPLSTYNPMQKSQTDILSSSQLLAWHSRCWWSENLIPHWRLVSDSFSHIAFKDILLFISCVRGYSDENECLHLFFLWLHCHATVPHCHLPFISNENPTLEIDFLNPCPVLSSLLNLFLKTISFSSAFPFPSLHPTLPSLPSCNLSFISNVKMALILDAVPMIGN